MRGHMLSGTRQEMAQGYGAALAVALLGAVAMAPCVGLALARGALRCAHQARKHDRALQAMGLPALWIARVARPVWRSPEQHVHL